MTYDKAKYQALRSLEVPRDIALALADDDNPLAVPQAAAVEDSVGAADVAALETKVNELLGSLRDSGLLET